MTTPILVLIAMVFYGGAQSKIFDTVIVSNSIEVVNDFPFHQKTANVLFHYKTMLIDFAASICALGMSPWSIYGHIAYSIRTPAVSVGRIYLWIFPASFGITRHACLGVPPFYYATTCTYSWLVHAPHNICCVPNVNN